MENLEKDENAYNEALSDKKVFQFPLSFVYVRNSSVQFSSMCKIRLTERNINEINEDINLR